MKNINSRLILLLIAIIIWIGILIYDIQENVHVLMIIADVFVIAFLFFKSLQSTLKVKSVQQVENEIAEIENSKKSA